METKICTKCKLDKEESEFSKISEKSKNYKYFCKRNYCMYYCKECNKNRVKLYLLDPIKKEKSLIRANNNYKKNKSYIKIKSKEFRLKNKDKIKEYNKNYRLKNEDYLKNLQKEWRFQNKEQVKENSRLWYNSVKNNEKYLNNTKIYRLNNKEKIKQTNHNYNILNKNKISEQKQKQVLNLTNNYIRITLISNGLEKTNKINDIPLVLIEAKRQALLLKRKIKNNEQSQICN